MDYKNGKIYKIVCDETNMTYYGSTCSKLTKRLNAHKSNKNACMTKYMTNPKIYLVEDYPCERKEQLTMRERYYIENNECCNKMKKLNRTDEEKKEYNKEYIKVNREILNEKKKEFHNKNRCKIIEKKKEIYQNKKEELKKKIICECGTEIRETNYIRHTKSKKHLKLLSLI